MNVQLAWTGGSLNMDLDFFGSMRAATFRTSVLLRDFSPYDDYARLLCLMHTLTKTKPMGGKLADISVSPLGGLYQITVTDFTPYFVEQLYALTDNGIEIKPLIIEVSDDFWLKDKDFEGQAKEILAELQSPRDKNTDFKLGRQRQRGR